MERVRVTCDCGHMVECLAYGTGIDIEEYKGYLSIYGCPRCVFGDISLPELDGPEHMIERARDIRRQRIEHMLYTLRELEQLRRVSRTEKDKYRRAGKYLMEITRAGFWLHYQYEPLDYLLETAARTVEKRAGSSAEIRA